MRSCSHHPALHLQFTLVWFSSGFLHAVKQEARGRLKGVWKCGKTLWSASYIFSVLTKTWAKWTNKIVWIHLCYLTTHFQTVTVVISLFQSILPILGSQGVKVVLRSQSFPTLSVWVSRRDCFPSPVPPLSFQCFISGTGTCIFSLLHGASWLGCLDLPPWEQSPSRNRLPIVEAPGFLRHPTSTLRGSC